MDNSIPSGTGLMANPNMFAKQDSSKLETPANVIFTAPAVNYVKKLFTHFEQERLGQERIWMRCYKNFRGQYGPDTVFREHERSRAFIKITKTKIMAAVSQVSDILFSTSRFPITVDPTEVPEGVPDKITISAKGSTPTQLSKEEKAVDSPYGFPGDGQEWPEGKIVNDIVAPPGSGANVEYSENAPQEGDIQLEPALIAAKRLEKMMIDQLEESGATVELRNAITEAAMLGTGCIRGVESINKVYHGWTRDEDTKKLKYTPITKLMPTLSAPTIWNIYVDPDASTPNSFRRLIQRHKVSKEELRELSLLEQFRGDVCLAIADTYAPDYTRKWFENALDSSSSQDARDCFEILEFWGPISKKDAIDSGLMLPEKSFDNATIVNVNIWVCAGQVIRMVLNPFTPNRLPFLLLPWEVNPYSVWGVGIAENMEDTQLIMNGHLRMAIDNLALAGNVVFEIDESMLAPGEDMRVFPGRIFRRQSGPPGQAIFAHKWQTTTNENLQMFDKARQLADEATAIPSYSHGQLGVSGMTRTSSGMSMLMSAAAASIKLVIKNIDDFVIRPLGEALFAWNMQFNTDMNEGFRGDLEIKARGTTSLMMKEVRSQRLMTFMQVGANQMLAPFIKWPVLLTEIARELDIDPEKLINNTEEAKAQALLLSSLVPGQSGAKAGGIPAGSGSVAPDLSGAGGEGSMAGAMQGSPSAELPGGNGGNIGTGGIPMPGQKGFAG